MSPSATPATQSEPRCHRGSPVRSVPHLPHKVSVTLTKCDACHAKRPSMPPSATPATQRTAPSAVSATPGTQSERRSHQVPIDATKGHARHPKDRGVTATKRATMSQPSVASATPATQSERRCHQCYACRAMDHGLTATKWPTRGSPLASVRCHQAPRLPRKGSWHYSDQARHQSPSAVSAGTRVSGAAAVGRCGTW